MATVKIVTWSRPDKDGQYPIGFKISKNGKPSYIFEGHTLPSRDLWDAKKQEVRKSKSIPNAARLTNYLTNRLAELRNKALQLETGQTVTDAAEIKEAYQAAHKPAPEPDSTTFKEIPDMYLEEQKSCGNYDVYAADKSLLKRFYSFSRNGNITSWTTAASSGSYAYNYEQINRLTSGSTADSKYSETGISYDLMGNIKTLVRTYNSTLIDNLTYGYSNTNQVQSITDQATDTGPIGYKTGYWPNAYTYDANGNMITDNSKGITTTSGGIAYNLFNLPQSIGLPAGNKSNPNGRNECCETDPPKKSI